MKTKAIPLIILLFTGGAQFAAVSGSNSRNLKKLFLGKVWKNIRHINSDHSRFGSRGERVTAGVRGKSANVNRGIPAKAPTKKEVLKKVSLMKKMLFREDVKKSQRIRALYYLGACYLFLGDMVKTRFYFDRLFRYAPDSPFTQQLRRDISRAGAK